MTLKYKLHNLQYYFISYWDKIISQYKFNNYSFAIARSFFAIGTLSSLLFNSSLFLFNPTNGDHINHEILINKLSIFYLFSDHLVIAKSFSILVLVLVIIGYRPRYTCIFHWWVSFSFAASSFVVEGGDHITQIVTLLLIPICLFDRRKNHWNIKDSNFSTNILTTLSYYFIRIQVAVLYLMASVGKLAVDEWKDGTVLYYWFNDSIMGTPLILQNLTNFITSSPAILTLATWSSILLEFLLFMCIASFKNQRKYFLWIALSFHFFIFVFFGLFSFMFAMSGALILYLSSFKVEE